MVRVGILFGGKSREREISFAGGRSVYDILDKTLFQPVPIFIDSLGNFILLDWQYIYKGSIRDFYPPSEFYPDALKGYQLYIESLFERGDVPPELFDRVGERIEPSDSGKYFDIAFLCLHGPYGEDGTIQGLLDFYDIPYTGTGVLGSALGIDKGFTANAMHGYGLDSLEFQTKMAGEQIASLPVKSVIKPLRQGSSIGVEIVERGTVSAADKPLFRKTVSVAEFHTQSTSERRASIQNLAEVYESIGYPLYADDVLCADPLQLEEFLRSSSGETVTLQSSLTEPGVIIEPYMEGREFSCVVIDGPDGVPLALPPTEIVKSRDVYTYDSKYLPGRARKQTPMNLPSADLERVMSGAVEVYSTLGFEVYARIDGFYQPNGEIRYNDPNTTSGMLPSSFFFHQAAEVGIPPKQFLTYVILASIEARFRTSHKRHSLQKLLNQVTTDLSRSTNQGEQRLRIGIILGGYSTERHISVESGRNVYEKLSSLGKYDVVPIFLKGDESSFTLWKLPVSMLLKDNADDISEALSKHSEVDMEGIRAKFAPIRSVLKLDAARFDPQQIPFQSLSERIDFAFLALHGRPGEDGQIQRHLDEIGIPYNGSGPKSSSLTIDKFETNRLLRESGLMVAEHALITPDDEYLEIADCLGYPLIAKPADDGCSSAVIRIDSPRQLTAYAEAIFGNSTESLNALRAVTKSPRGEFPKRTYFLIETLIDRKGADGFLEITGGVVTRYEGGTLKYIALEPSESIAGKGILSLEEKFLAGEGRNITPPGYSDDSARNREIGEEVKGQLARAAEICGVEGYCRIDAFVRVYPSNIEVIIIEINSLPGLTPATAIFHQAAHQCIKPAQFLDGLIAFGLQRKERHASAQA